jgi:hypothetical protein
MCTYLYIIIYMNKYLYLISYMHKYIYLILYIHKYIYVGGNLQPGGGMHPPNPS